MRKQSDSTQELAPFARSLSAVSASLKRREISPVELVSAILDRIASVEPVVKAFVSCYADEAMTCAAIAEEEITNGNYRGPLHGIPLGVKDIYDIVGRPTLSGTKARYDHVAEEDATVVARLRAAGAIILGKTTTHEIAFGVMTPPTRNPWDTRFSAGGSSGGSAAAVAAGTIFAGMGSDTGGSIRGPAALCGVVGLKPTFGRVSKFGVLSNTWSFDAVGPITRTVRDAAIVLSATAGFDQKDNATVPVDVPQYEESLDGDLRGMRVAIPVNYFFRHIDARLDANVRAVGDRLAALGARISEVTVPYAEAYHPVMYACCLPEIAAYHEETLRKRADQFGPDIRHTLLAGSLMRAGEYLRAQRVRELIRLAWRELFNDIDILLVPTHPTSAPRTDQSAVVWEDGTDEDVLSVYSRLTAPASVTGYPAISVPCGLDDRGLPYGAQFVGRPFEEETVLKVADAYERTLSWTDTMLGGPLGAMDGDSRL
jgi:aspartyl-tRNA(Asn)/glutamyl-tRNA(Gln) amidotransferase subunit A